MELYPCDYSNEQISPPQSQCDTKYASKDTPHCVSTIVTHIIYKGSAAVLQQTLCSCLSTKPTALVILNEGTASGTAFEYSYNLSQNICHCFSPESSTVSVTS
jgi:hypothetical protein